MNSMVKEFFRTKEDDKDNCSIDLKQEELKVEAISPTVTVESIDSKKKKRKTVDGVNRSLDSQSSFTLKSALKKSNFDVSKKKLRSTKTIDL